MRKTLIIVGMVLALIFGGAVFLTFVTPVSVTVRNDSEQGITAVSVTVQDRRLDFPDLAPGRSARRWFVNSGEDSGYSLLAHRSDGAQISETEGYITSWLSVYSTAEFTVTRSGVTFTEDY